MIRRILILFTYTLVSSIACPPDTLSTCGLGLGSCGLGLGGYGNTLGGCGLGLGAYGPGIGLGLGNYGLGLGACSPSISSLGLGLGSCGLDLASSTAGPTPLPSPVLPAPPVCLPGAPSPIIELPTPPVPPTQVLDNKCVCTKTVVKPQVYQRLVDVPSYNRFLKKSFVPVVENIPYTANALCGTCGSTTYPSLPLNALLPNSLGLRLPGCGCSPTFGL